MTDETNSPINIHEVKRLSGIDPKSAPMVEFITSVPIADRLRRRRVLAEAAGDNNGARGGGGVRAAPYYYLDSSGSVDEGSNLTIAVGGTNIPNGTYYWTIAHGTTNDADFAAVSGTVSVSSNYGSFTISPAADSTTEGAETFSVYLRSGSITGPVLTLATGFTINDTSLSAPTYNWTAPSGFTGYYIFNGTNQRLSTPGNSDFSPGTGDFTIEFIINKQNSGGFPRVFSVGTYPSAKVACSIESGAHVYFWIGGSIAADVDCSSLSGFPAFQYNWHHVVLQRKSGKCQIYVDGNQVGSTTTGNVYNIDTSSAQLNIACESAAGGTYAQYMNTYLTEFRWTNSAVYPDASFPVPSAPLTVLANTKIFLPMSSSGVGLTDTSAAPHTFTPVNAPTWHAYP